MTKIRRVLVREGAGNPYPVAQPSRKRSASTTQKRAANPLSPECQALADFNARNKEFYRKLGRPNE